MKAPDVEEYLAILIDSNGRILLRTKPADGCGFFIRAEPSVGEGASASIVDAIFRESGLRVRVIILGGDVYFGSKRMSGYCLVELDDADGDIGSSDLFVDWYDFEEAADLISSLKDDRDFELEMAVLGEASNIVHKSSAVAGLGLDRVTGASELESFKQVCIDVDRVLSGEFRLFRKGGVISDLVMRVIDDYKKRIDRGEIDSGYLSDAISKVEKGARSKQHEYCLLEVIAIFATRAHGFLRSGDLTGYKEEHLSLVKYIGLYDAQYPEEGRARRERGFKGGEGKAKMSAEVSRRVARGEDIVYQAILSVLRAHAPYRARINAISIADKIIDEVSDIVHRQGAQRNHDDLRGCILDCLVNDDSAKKIVEFR